MQRTRRLRLAATALLSTTLVVACGDDSDPSPTTEPTGLPNPASAFCVEQGGTVDIVDEEGGQVGYCVLPDGTRVEEWEYYRSESDNAGG